MSKKLKRTPNQGTIAVEAAILLPVVFLLLVGLGEMGWLMMNRQHLQGAAGVGARTASHRDSTTSDVVNSIDAYLLSANVPNNLVTIATSPAEVFNASPGTLVTVTLTMDYGPASLTNTSLIIVPETVQVTTTSMKQGTP